MGHLDPGGAGAFQEVGPLSGTLEEEPVGPISKSRLLASTGRCSAAVAPSGPINAALVASANFAGSPRRP
jgi:hypothetical protein